MRCECSGKVAEDWFLMVSFSDIYTYSCAFSCHTTNGLLKEVRPLGVFRMSSAGAPLCHTHWLYLTANTIIYATAASTTAVDAEPTLHLAQLVDNEVKLIASKTLPSAGRIHRLCGISATEIAVATTAGLFRIRLSAFTAADGAPLTPVYTYPDAPEHLCCSADGQHVFALKPKHWLYHNGRSVASGVTSMHPAEQYLLFTTLDVLRFVRLADGAIVGDRRIERGARLVSVVPHDCRTVLQMPRGNLEAIQPRVLALCIIGRQLDAGSYQRAFDAMRKQRINLNLLMDHTGAAFLERVPEFVRSVRNVQWLNLFLSDLDEADVTVTMYGSNYPGRSAATVPGGKVAEVCRRVREVVYELGLEDELLLTILTSYVRQKEYEPALRLLWQIKRAEGGSGGAPEVSAADALKHLLYLADVNELYNVALGMYEFDLVRFIAAKSQKDPKEYLPHLAGLEQIDDRNYRHYRVDVHLKRYERALGHIVGCLAEHADECVELVQKQALFAVALRLFEGIQSDADVAATYVRIQHAYAEHLREHGKFRDACLMYERCGAYAQAILSARHILDWQKCVGLARRMGQTDAEIGKLAGSLVPALVENGQRLDAAQLVLKYQQDVGQAVGILCDGRFYVQALFEARMGDESLIGEVRMRGSISSDSFDAFAFFRVGRQAAPGILRGDAHLRPGRRSAAISRVQRAARRRSQRSRGSPPGGPSGQRPTASGRSGRGCLFGYVESALVTPFGQFARHRQNASLQQESTQARAQIAQSEAGQSVRGHCAYRCAARTRPEGVRPADGGAGAGQGADRSAPGSAGPAGAADVARSVAHGQRFAGRDLDCRDDGGRGVCAAGGGRAAGLCAGAAGAALCHD